MIELSRTIRFCVNDAAPSGDAATARDNTFSAWPPMRGLGRYYELEVVCVGEADPVTGYFMNIKLIDAAVREHVLPIVDRAVHTAASSATLAMGELMRTMHAALQPALNHTVDQICFHLTPWHALTLRSRDMDRIEISQQYEFSAAHRLHVETLSDEENRKVFGKCNNPAGHGHNYRVEVTAAVPIDDAGQIARVEQLDAIVNEYVIEQLDHKHLNHDVPQFAHRNPSVEHIAAVVWDMLADKIACISGELTTIRVWETGKTVCTYRGPQVEARV